MDHPHLPFWKRVCVYYCDQVLKEYSVKEATPKLKQLCFLPDSERRDLFRKVANENPVLWLADEEGDLPSTPVFSWEGLYEAIVYYPHHMVGYVLEHLDRDLESNTISEKDIVGAAIQTDRVSFIFQTAVFPLRLTLSYVAEIFVSSLWETHLDVIRTSFLEKATENDLIDLLEEVALYSSPEHQLTFLKDNISRDVLLQANDLLKNLVVSGNDRCLTSFAKGELPLPRRSAAMEACAQNAAIVLRTLLKGEAYQDIEEWEDIGGMEGVKEMVCEAMTSNADECLFLLHRLFPRYKCRTEEEVAAFMQASRATQVSVVEYGFIHIDTVVKKLNFFDLLQRVSGAIHAQLHYSMSFNLSLIARRLELAPHLLREPETVDFFTLVISKKKSLFPSIAHLLTADIIFRLIQGGHIETLQKQKVDIPFHLWITSKECIVPIYWIAKEVQGASVPVTQLSFTLDLITHVQEAARCFLRNDSRRIPLLIDGSPHPMTRRCALIRGREYAFSAYGTSLTPQNTTFPLLYHVRAARLVHFNVSVTETSDGKDGRALLTACMLNCDTAKTFYVTQTIPYYDEDDGVSPFEIEDELCAWKGDVPSRTSIHIKDLVDDSQVYFTVIRPCDSVMTSVLNKSQREWLRIRSPRRAQQPRTTRRLSGSSWTLPQDLDPDSEEDESMPTDPSASE